MIIIPISSSNLVSKIRQSRVVKTPTSPIANTNENNWEINYEPAKLKIIPIKTKHVPIIVASF